MNIINTKSNISIMKYYNEKKIETLYKRDEECDSSGDKILYDTQGRVIGIAHTVNGYNYGKGYSYDEQGTLISYTNYVLGERHGIRLEFYDNYANGRVKSFKHYSYGELVGTSAKIHDTGYIDEIEYHIGNGSRIQIIVDKKTKTVCEISMYMGCDKHGISLEMNCFNNNCSNGALRMISEFVNGKENPTMLSFSEDRDVKSINVRLDIGKDDVADFDAIKKEAKAKYDEYIELYKQLNSNQ